MNSPDSDQRFRKSLDLGYLQANANDDLDEVDYEALRNMPRVDPDAHPAPDQGEGEAQAQEAHAPEGAATAQEVPAQTCCFFLRCLYCLL